MIILSFSFFQLLKITFIEIHNLITHTCTISLFKFICSWYIYKLHSSINTYRSNQWQNKISLPRVFPYKYHNLWKNTLKRTIFDPFLSSDATTTLSTTISTSKVATFVAFWKSNQSRLRKLQDATGMQLHWYAPDPFPSIANPKRGSFGDIPSFQLYPRDSATLLRVIFYGECGFRRQTDSTVSFALYFPSLPFLPHFISFFK